MNSFLFPDVNVWLALTFDRHVHHDIAKRWYEQLPGESQLYFCRITQIGLLRLLTTVAVMGERYVMNQKAAWSVYDQWFSDDRISFLPEPPGFEEVFRNFSHLRLPAPKDWADSYLTAFASSADLALVTFDQALHRKTSHAILLKNL